MKRRTIWITWLHQRRNIGISKAIGAALYEYDYRNSGLARYPISLWLTIATINKQRPNIVFGQNPSIILALLLVILKRIYNYCVCIDAHNAGITPLGGRYSILNLVSRYIQNRADLTLVSNAALKRTVEQNGGRAFVLPDRLPRLKNATHLKLKGHHKILYVCTFSDDEPYHEVIKSRNLLSDDIHIYITGNYRKVLRNQNANTNNITFTGYVSDEEYVRLLLSVDAIMVLTSREDCLVCGAYEAVSAEKPMILSDTNALRGYFCKGAVYTRNNNKHIAESINTVIKYRHKLEGEVQILKEELAKDWEKRQNALKDLLNKMTGHITNYAA